MRQPFMNSGEPQATAWKADGGNREPVRNTDHEDNGMKKPRV